MTPVSQRGDIDIQQYHDDPGKLAGNASMLKMFASALDKKEMPPSNEQLQPTAQERAEMVTALNSLIAEAPAGAANMQGDAMAKNSVNQLIQIAPLNLDAQSIQHYSL